MKAWAILTLLPFALAAQGVYLWPESFNLQNGQRFSVGIHSGNEFPESQAAPPLDQIKDATLYVPKFQYNLVNLRPDGLRALVDGVAKTRGNVIVTVRSGTTGFAKALMMTELPGDFGMQPVGLEFEIVPLTNPANVLPGQRMAVQVLYKGQAAADVELNVTSSNGEPAPAGKTDAEGKLSVLLPRGGAYRLRAVRPNGSETFCTTFVFSLR